MIVIYHENCVDGFTAAWVAHRFYGDAATYVPAKYGDLPPDVEGQDVLVVDFSYPRAVLEAMYLRAKSLRVFDHHKTAAEDLAGLYYARFDMNRSGAGITWDELSKTSRRLQEEPSFVDYVEDRDLWTWRLPHSKEISAYIGSKDRDFAVWDTLSTTIEHRFPMAVAAGSAILEAKDKYVREKYAQARQIVFEGHSILAINTTHATSELVGRMAEAGAFALGWFQDERGRFVYSLRSRGDKQDPKGFDVSAIARKYGGGGHHNAAGFTLDRLIV